MTLVSAVRLQPGTERAHRRLHDRAVSDAQQLGGLLRAELVSAIPAVQPETVALFTFADRPSLDRWLAAQERDRVLEAMSHLVDGERTVTVLGNFAGWFAGQVESEPPRWKQAVAVLAGLVPVALAVATTLRQLVHDLPLAGSVAISSTVNVVVLTWLVMPRLTKALRPWLLR